MAQSHERCQRLARPARCVWVDRDRAGTRVASAEGILDGIAAAAPRYDPRLLAAVRRLDDASQSMAETCRLVGAEMARLGLPRPSYVHLRRYIRAERERRRRVRELGADVLAELAQGRTPDASHVIGRYVEAHARAELQRRS